MASVKLLDPQDPKNRLDRYELIGEIAAGGMAVVYLARIAGLGGFQRFVAIKRLHPHLAQEQEFVEMFLDEARLAAGIHNPHVVPILEVGGGEPGGYYLVMEYIEGDTLARVAARAAGRATGMHPNLTAVGASELPKRPKRAPASMPSAGPAVPRPVTVRIILDSLAGLHAAHELTDPHGRSLQLVHRDISPQNILVGVDGSARITDFGVARAAARLSTTRSDTVKGKLAYLSPEQARGETVDRRTDLFAMGIMLWELMTGRRLFRGETDHETLARVLSGTIPAPSSMVPGMHPAFDAVVLKALSRDVSQRFSTCAEMGDALERAAMEAASAGSEGGVAPPRDVAAFMNTVLGQEVAAQRESVRVWLSQRNDPSLASSRPPPPASRMLRATGQQAIVASLPAPPLPPGMTPTGLPPDIPMEQFVPPVPHPDDGDPTTMRHVSSLTNASIAVRSKPSSEHPPFARRSNAARVAAVVGVAALLAVGVVVLLKSGDASPPGSPVAMGQQGLASPGAPGTAASPTTQASTAAPAASSAQSVSSTASAAPTAAPTAAPDTPSADPLSADAASSDGPSKTPGKWRPPTAKTSAPTATPAAPPATTPPAATTPPSPPPKATSTGDDLSNPYK